MNNLTETITRLRRDVYEHGTFAKINDALAFATACLDTTPITQDCLRELEWRFEPIPMAFARDGVEFLLMKDFDRWLVVADTESAQVGSVTTRGELISLLFGLGVI